MVIWRIVLLLLGIAAYAVMAAHVGGFDDPSQIQAAGQVVAVIAAVGAAMLPSVRNGLNRIPAERPRGGGALCVVAVSMAYFVVSASVEGRWNAPAIHDEQMFRTQATLLAHGRLWMPEHPLADFFETFHILVKPVYAPISFPGTAIFFVAAVWIGLPLWIVSLVIAGGVVGFIYRIAGELIDARAGLVAALVAVASPGIGAQSIEILPYLPALLLELGMVWACLRWREHGNGRWAAVAGMLAGWAMITRPLDAVCFILPVSVATIWRMGKMPAKSRWITVGAAVVAAAPFVSLQLIFDWGVTGHLFQTPFSFYLSRVMPGLQFSVTRNFAPAGESASHLTQIQDYYREWLVPMLKQDGALPLPILWLRNLANVGQQAMPTAKLMVVFPAGLAALATRRRGVILATLALFLLLYSFYSLFISAYAMLALPVTAMALAAVPYMLGITAPVRAGLTAAIIGLSVAGLLPAKPQSAAPPELPVIDRVIAENVHPPAVVLFRYGQGCDPHQEPVYNPDVCWPDDAPIIRAQDLGERDGELIRYYQRIQPDRKIYFYDRATRQLVIPRAQQ